MTVNDLLPLIYNELRALAAQRLQQEQQPISWQPSALVNEVYLRLVKTYPQYNWSSQGDFFRAAADVMRKILIDRARARDTLKHGGEWERIEFPRDIPAEFRDPAEQVIIDELLRLLERREPEQADTLLACPTSKRRPL